MFEELKKLQQVQPWTDIWSEGYLGDPRPYKGFQHCMTNVVAKAGAILQRIEMADHYGESYSLALNSEKDVRDLAFIIMSALKAGNAYPNKPLDIFSIIKSDMERRSK